MNTEITNFEHYLQRLHIKTLNNMQEEILQKIETDPNLVVLSATGSGKTLGFLLPIISKIDVNLKKVQAVIMAPSRELALQIEDVAKKMQLGVKILACYGGHKREIEENSLVEAPVILIGTAGRLADHLRRGNVDLSAASFLVIDEFDKMLELGFVEEMEFILRHLKQTKNRILTSATDLANLPDFTNMQEATRLNFLTETAPGENDLRVHILHSPDKDKIDTLVQFLSFARDTSSIVFANHREAVERTSELLKEKGISNVFYHGGMEQRDREVALTKFKNGTSDILVTTDLASRGLDIDNIRNIVHYHIPLEESSFTHRNGRTARMGKTGNVYIIVSNEEKIPAYVQEVATDFDLPENNTLPEKPKWSTLFIDAGKKDKISKSDIVGFLSQKGDLRREDLGLVEVKDFIAFAAVRRSRASHVLESIKDEKLKGRKIKIALAK